MGYKNKKNIVYISLIVLLAVIIIILSICLICKDDTSNFLIIGKDDDLESDTVNDVSVDNVDNNSDFVFDADIEVDDSVNVKEDTQISVDNDNVVDNGNYDDSSDDSQAFEQGDVVAYFKNMEYDVTNSSSFKEKFKEYFIDVVDFIFYDKEVMGYTFNELTNMTKLKVISVAIKIDSKIEEFVPNYKETISSTGSKVYNDIKEKLIVSYMDISVVVCEDNENECAKVKEMFSDIKDKSKIGWDFIKGLVSGGIYKLKDWYEIYSGK